MNDEQYNDLRAFQQEEVVRNLMLLLSAAFPHLARDINEIGRRWDSRLDALDDQRAWESRIVSVEPAGADTSKESTK